MAKKMVGVVYILTNPAFPDLVKIGYANDLETRLNYLSSRAAAPYSFQVYAYYDVTQRLSDKIIHSMIDALNPDLRTVEEKNGKKRVREFYAMPPEDAYAILEGIARISGTEKRLHLVKDDGSEEIKKMEEDQIESQERRSPFSFKKCGIPEKAKIHFKDNPKYVATVVDDKKVEYNGSTYTLRGLTKELMETLEGRYSKSWQGARYWTYKGKLLIDIRTEREKKGLYK